MSLIQAIIMGLIQGLTEFLPVSSSGHLALFRIAFGIDTEVGSVYTVLLHLGTLIAIYAVYFRDINKLILEAIKMFIEFLTNIFTFFANLIKGSDTPYNRVVRTQYRKFVMLVIVSTIPTGIIGIVGKDMVEKAEGVLLIPGICLIITSILLLISDFIPDGEKKPGNVTYSNAFMIGIAQGIATMPGISRSGTTIAACVMSGFERSFAVKYSFIMSVPAVLGAALLKLKDLGEVAESSNTDMHILLIGTVVSAVVGYIAIKAMLYIVKKKKFIFFSLYCFVVGVASIYCYFTM
ncbi:MAG: undecaprenyl-diphosphate phosphatase [Lachnospiraceae bacterium]|nr:undecaprenyl-diphosphate phosphatase [Lachnospiraceae bacterium]